MSDIAIDPSSFVYHHPDSPPHVTQDVSGDPPVWTTTARNNEPKPITQAALIEGAGETADKQNTSCKPLSAYLVNHTKTLGMTEGQIEALRPPYVVDCVIRQGELGLLGAESKSRKTWLMQDMGFSVAAGLPWLAEENGTNGFATEKATVHVMDLELNTSEMLFRCAKARRNRFVDDPKMAAEVTDRIKAYSLDGLNVITIMPLIEELKGTVRPGDLVVVDCLYRICPDGNETAEVADILETLKRFASETRTAVILVDHFRKAGDEKARNRFAGSFVKQASASTLIAIEVTADDLLTLNFDARTFHGCQRAYARFNLDTYTFDRVSDLEVTAARQGKAQAEAEGWLVHLWKSRSLDCTMTAADASERWKISRQSASPRLKRLVARGWMSQTINGTGKLHEWTLEPAGLVIVKNALGIS